MSTESKTITVGSVFESGASGGKKWWILDSLNPDTDFAVLTRLRWAEMSEPGVMYRTEEKIRFKNRGVTYLHSYKLGSFYVPKHPITVKP